MSNDVVVAVVGGTFSLASVGLSGLAANWSRRAHNVGTNNARELVEVKQQIDNRQDKMILQAVKEYVKSNPGMVDYAVAHEAMRDLLSELVGLHLSPEEVESIRMHHGRRRTGD